MTYRLLVFDFDGTLANTRQAVLTTIRQTLHAHPGAATQAEIEAVVASGATLPATFAALLGGPQTADPTAVAQAVLTYRRIYQNNSARWTTLYPGVVPFLTEAKAAKAALAVVSNKGAAHLQASLAALSILDAFDLVVGERPNLRPKPFADIFTDVLQPAFPTVPPAEILMIGDTAADIQFAKNAGIASCWVTYGHGTAETCQPLAPDHVIANLSELLPQIFNPKLSRTT